MYAVGNEGQAAFIMSDCFRGVGFRLWPCGASGASRRLWCKLWRGAWFRLSRRQCDALFTTCNSQPRNRQPSPPTSSSLIRNARQIPSNMTLMWRVWRRAATPVIKPALWLGRGLAFKATPDRSKSKARPARQGHEQSNKTPQSQQSPSDIIRELEKTYAPHLSGHIFYNHELMELAKTDDIALPEKYKRLPQDALSEKYAIKIFVGTKHNFSPFHITGYLLVQHPLTPKYMSLYRDKRKNPLWSYILDTGRTDIKPYVRETSKKMWRRAWLGALKANNYRPNGKALAVDSVRGTELYGTVKFLVLDSHTSTAQDKLLEMTEYLTAVLRTQVIPLIRRRVAKPANEEEPQRGNEKTSW